MLIMVHYIYTLNGMALFDQRAKFNSANEVDMVEGAPPMFNFNGFMNSLLTVFIVMTNDGQSTIYYNYYRAVGATSSTLYWVTFVVIVQKVLVNMFSAILLHWHKDVKDRFTLIKEQQKQLQAQEELEKENQQKTSSEAGSVGGDLTLKKEPSKLKKIVDKMYEAWKKFKNLKFFGFKKESKEKDSAIRDPYKNNKNQLKVSGRSLSYLNEDSLLREWLHKMLQSPIFDLMIVGVIIVSSVSLALDKPTLDPQSNQKLTLQWLDISTIIIFSFEAFSKIVAYGFVFNGVDSYLRNFWNIMDFIVLMFSYLCLSPQAEQFRFIKVLRILRSLRLISRNDGLKVAVRAFLSALPNILGMTVIMTMFFIIFGIISVHYFRGRLYFCTNEIPSSEVLQSKWDCLNLGGLWVNRTFNFDNIINAWITLFTMSTTAGWAEMMIHTISSTELDYIPDFTTRSTYWILFYMLFMIVLTFFFMNLFGAVVINTFMEQTNRLGGGIFLTNRQKEWIDIRKMIIRTKPMKKHQPPSDSKFRLFFFKLQSHRYFDRFIFVSIIQSTLLLMLKWYKQSDAMDNFTEIMNIIFTVIFFMEVIIRILGIRIRNYFEDPWGRFDFSVAIGSLISLLLYRQSSIKIKFLSFIKGFKILRLIRLLNRGGRTLSLVFNTFVVTMQQLTNIGGLLFLFMYMYSILGMIYFGEVKRNGSMNDYINFENFTSAFITLFTVATADSWNYTTASFTWDSEPNNKCIENPSYQDFVDNNNQTIGCSTRESAFIFFISFMYIFSMVFLRIFITTIIQGYQESRVQDDRIFNYELCQRFKECWAEFDPQGTSFIKLCDLREFLFLLGSPLGFDESYRQNRFKQDRFIALLDLPIYNSFSNYYFTDVLDSLSFRAMVLDQLQQLYKDEEEEENNNEEQDKGAAPGQDENGSQKGSLSASKFNQQDKMYHEQRIKKKLEREVNRLIYNKQSEQIIEFQELFQQEMQKKMKMVDQDEDLGRFTSQHHMAIEAAIRKIKLLLEASRQRKAAEQNTLQPSSQDGEVAASNSSPNIKKSSMFKMFSLALKIKKKIGSNKKLMNLKSQQTRLVGSQNDVIPRNRNESDFNMTGGNQMMGAATVTIPRLTYQQ